MTSECLFRFALVLAGCLLLLPVGGCDDTTRADAGAVPTAPAAGSETPALWRPGAILASADGRSLYVAEIASRRLRVVDIERGTATTLFDLAPSERRWDLGWGQALLGLTDGRLLLGGTGRTLWVLDAQGVEAPLELGRGPGGLAPAQGVALGEVDLSTLQGLTGVEGSDALVLLLAGRLWRAVPAPGADSHAALAAARLEPLAGDGSSGRGPELGDALAVPLELIAGRWEGVLAAPSGRVLFVERDRLRLVEDGRIVTVTGTGSTTGAQPIELADFGSRFTGGPSSRGIWHQGVAHFTDNTVVRRFEIDSVDLATGAVEGRVTALAGEIPETGGLASSGERFFLSFGLGGTLLEIARGDDGRPKLEPVFGPLEDFYTLRYGIEDTNAEDAVTDEDRMPYRLGGLLLPQALASIAGGQLVLANQPLARLISSIDRSREPGAVPQELAAICAPPGSPEALAACPFWADARSAYGVGPIASDNRLQFYGAAQGKVVRSEFGNPDETGVVVANLWAPSASGIPGPGRDVVLETTAALVGLDDADAVLLAMPRLLARYDSASGRVEHEVGPPRGVSPLRRTEAGGLEGVPFFALDLRGATAFAGDASGLRLVAVPDPDTERGGAVLGAGAAELASVVAGESIGANKFERVLGGGLEPLTDGVLADEVHLEAIDAVALLARADAEAGVPQRAVLAAVRADDGSGALATALVTVDADARVTRLTGACGAPPVAAGWLGVIEEGASPGLVLLQERTAAGGAGLRRLYACRPAGSAPAALGARVLEAEAWVELAEASSPLAPALSGSTLAVYETWRGVPVVWLHALAFDGAEQTMARRHDLLIGREERVEAITARLDGALVVVAVDGPDGRLLLEARVPGREAPGHDAAQLPALSRIAGGGQVLASGLSVRETMFGEWLETLAVGPEGALYLAMRDTASIWRIDPGEGAPGEGAVPDRDDLAELLWFGAPLFDGGEGPWPMAVGSDGELWIGSGERVFALRDGAPRLVAGGGAVAPADGVPALSAALGRVRGLAAEGTTRYVLTERALVAIEAPGGAEARLRVLAREGELVLGDGQRWPLEQSTVTQPAMVVGRAGELLIAAPARHEILTVPTDWRP